jgi:hypothetical protein
VDRLRCLGNAVVPQVAEYIGRLIMEDAIRELRPTPEGGIAWMSPSRFEELYEPTPALIDGSPS